jgi:hypothetical protein
VRIESQTISRIRRRNGAGASKSGLISSVGVIIGAGSGKLSLYLAGSRCSLRGRPPSTSGA